jgi:hypothetical protein
MAPAANTIARPGDDHRRSTRRADTRQTQTRGPVTTRHDVSNTRHTPAPHTAKTQARGARPSDALGGPPRDAPRPAVGATRYRLTSRHKPRPRRHNDGHTAPQAVVGGACADIRMFQTPPPSIQWRDDDDDDDDDDEEEEEDGYEDGPRPAGAAAGGLGPTSSIVLPSRMRVATFRGWEAGAPAVSSAISRSAVPADRMRAGTWQSTNGRRIRDDRFSSSDHRAVLSRKPAKEKTTRTASLNIPRAFFRARRST